MSKNKLLILICLFLTGFSCNDQLIYNQYQTIENGLWEETNELLFSFEIEDTTIPYNLTLELRNTGFYPFRNLWLKWEEIRPERESKKDTLAIILTDDTGNWLGSGISLFETEYALYKGYYFPHTGTYTYRFKHGMYKNPLPGIQEIGLRLDKGK